MERVKKFGKGYGTVAFNLLLVAAALLDVLPGIKEYLPETWYAILTITGTFGNMIIRVLRTSTPFGKSGE